jgi:hypothetical protein
MSTETVTPVKKSILTVAMEKVQADKMKKKLDADAQEITSEIDSRKKSVRNAILAVGTVVTLTIVAVKLVSNMAEVEDETPAEDTPSED